MSVLLGIFVLATCVIAVELSARGFLARSRRIAQDKRESFFERIWPAHVRYHDYRAALDYRYIRLFSIDPRRAKWPHFRFDDQGFRLDRHDIRIGAGDGYKVAWMFGNSTLAGLGCREDETIPAYLNDELAASGSLYRVANLGVGGMSSTQELLLLIELLHAGFKPDAIVVYDGIIDQAKSHWVREAPHSWQDWQRGTGLARKARDAEHEANMSDFDYVKRIANDLRILFRQRLALPTLLRRSAPAGARSRPVAGGNWPLVVRRYLQNANIIAAIADRLGIPVVIYFQPLLAYEEHYLVRRLSAVEVDLLSTTYTDEHVRRDLIYSPQFAELRELLGDRFVDLSEIFRGRDDETLYGDPRHPNASGNAIIARSILDDLMTNRRLETADSRLA
jgi:lysophospholipase L1-like esterase